MDVKPVDRKITKITLALFLLNILAIIVFADRISLTLHDIFPALCFVFNILVIAVAYLYERKNLKSHIFRRGASADFYIVTASKYNREKKFDLMLVIHCSLLPFYLPTAFLTYKLQCVIPTIVLFFIPKLVSSVYNTVELFFTAQKNRIAQKQKDAQYEKERIEQERRQVEIKLLLHTAHPKAFGVHFFFTALSQRKGHLLTKLFRNIMALIFVIIK